MCTHVSSIQYYDATGILHTMVSPYIRRCISPEMFARVAKERIPERDKTKTPSSRSNSRNSKRRASPGTKQPDTYTVTRT